MGQLAIKGHPEKGKEVFEILEMLGGENPYAISETVEGVLYKISNYDNRIVACHPTDTFVVFTLEEFIEKYPYKVGNKVCFPDSPEHCLTIKRIWWNSDCSDLECTFHEDDIDVSVKDLQPYKEETMEEPKELIIGFTKDNNGDWVLNTHKDYEIKEIECKYEVVKKKPQYPKDYKECCEVLSLGEDGRLYTKGYKASLIQDFQQLLICRNAYWKMAGEQMRLDKSWKPDWRNGTQKKYCIYNKGNSIQIDSWYWCNTILAFPTKEMCDTFYKNFKKEIEQCKELL